MPNTVLPVVVNWTSDWTCAADGEWQNERVLLAAQSGTQPAAALQQVTNCVYVLVALCSPNAHRVAKGFVSWSLLPTGNVCVCAANKQTLLDVSVTSTQLEYQFNCLLLFSISLFHFSCRTAVLMSSSAAHQLLPCLVSRFLWSAEKTDSSVEQCVFIPIAAAVAAAAVWLQSAICRCVRTTAMHRYSLAIISLANTHTHTQPHRCWQVNSINSHHQHSRAFAPLQRPLNTHRAQICKLICAKCQVLQIN